MCVCVCVPALTTLLILSQVGQPHWSRPTLYWWKQRKKRLGDVFIHPRSAGKLARFCLLKKNLFTFYRSGKKKELVGGGGGVTGHNKAAAQKQLYCAEVGCFWGSGRMDV